MAHKVDYQTLEAEFISSEVSLRELARREGISNSTIADQARKRGWADKRANFKVQASEKQISKAADDFATRVTRLKDRSLTVMEGVLVRFAEQLADRENPMLVSEKGVDMAVKNILLLSGEATDRSESKVLGLNVNTTVPPELFAELEQLARRRLTS